MVTATVSASAVLAACSGCFAHNQPVVQKTARITLDNSTRTSHAVRCSQVNWELIADIGAAPGKVRVIVKLDPQKPSLETVDFDNFAGFSGVANSGAGNAKIRFANDTYKISGMAEGSQQHDPSVSVSKPFSIEVGC